MPPAREPLPDEDLSCPACLGAGELCTICERPTPLCSCLEPKPWFCGMCMGTGNGDAIDFGELSDHQYLNPDDW